MVKHLPGPKKLGSGSRDPRFNSILIFKKSEKCIGYVDPTNILCKSVTFLSQKLCYRHFFVELRLPADSDCIMKEINTVYSHNM